MLLIPYQSAECSRMRFEIIFLEKKLAAVEKKIQDFQKAQYAFEREYQNRLGDLAEAVMILRAQLGIADQDRGHVLAITQLNDEDYQRLKLSYKKAAKRCHPDYLLPRQCKRGLILFDQLNKAYHLQDSVQVEHILWLLETGQAFSKTPVVIVDAKQLRLRKHLLELIIVQKEDSFSQLKRQEEYDVANRDNWNILLYDYQTRLEDELAILRGRAAVISSLPR